MSFSKLIDMRRTPDEKSDSMMPIIGMNEYPYGLCLTLTQDELEKLEVDHTEWQIGDVFDLRAMAKVTSVSENETESGKCCRVELQIIMLGAESETDEYEEEPKRRRR